MAPDAPTPDTSPHSRACGWRAHPQGPECSTNCPTCHGGPMSDPSPDTPSVCPTCGSDKRNVRNNMDPRRIHPDWCEDTWHDAPATPTAPGSSSPDTAALVERLHDITRSIWRGGEFHYQLVLEQCGDIVAAADALEAQAARITELEAHNRRLAGTMTGDTATDLRVLYAYELGLADHTLTTPTEETP